MVSLSDLTTLSICHVGVTVIDDSVMYTNATIWSHELDVKVFTYDKSLKEHLTTREHIHASNGKWTDDPRAAEANTLHSAIIVIGVVDIVYKYSSWNYRNNLGVLFPWNERISLVASRIRTLLLMAHL